METIKLTNENIDILSEKVYKMYSDCQATKKDSIRARLLLEEVLIKYKNRFGEDIEIFYRSYKIFSQTRFVVRLRCPSFDPFTLEENPMAFMIESVRNSFEGTMPTWKYKNLENEIVFTVRKKAKLGGLSKIGIAVAVAIALAIPARLFLSVDVLKPFVTDYIDPISNAYAGLFCIMAVLLTFFAITLSIVRIGDMASAGAIGGRILRRFYAMSAIIVVILTFPILPFFQFGSSSSLSFAAKSIYDVLIGFIPSNIVSPFLNFNTMHIMIIGIMFGFSLLAMGQKGETTVKLFDECNLVSIYTNNFLNKVIYIFVGVKVFTLITTSDFTELKGAGKLVAILVLADIALLVFYTLYACLRCKIPIGKYIKNMIPHFVICISSANFGAAFSTIVDSLISFDSFGSVSQMAINLGSVVFRPSCTLVFIFSSLFMASAYGVEISIVWVITAVILSLLLVAAVPNIPGVSVSVITLLYAQLGLPAEAVALMIAINAPLQFLTVAVDTWCLAAECVVMTHKENKKIQPTENV